MMTMKLGLSGADSDGSLAKASVDADSQNRKAKLIGTMFFMAIVCSSWGLFLILFGLIPSRRAAGKIDILTGVLLHVVKRSLNKSVTLVANGIVLPFQLVRVVTVSVLLFCLLLFFLFVP